MPAHESAPADQPRLGSWTRGGFISAARWRECAFAALVITALAGLHLRSPASLGAADLSRHWPPLVPRVCWKSDREAAEAVGDVSVNVCMSTIPSRLEQASQMTASLWSILYGQSCEGLRIRVFLTVPRSSVREGSRYPTAALRRLRRTFDSGRLVVVDLAEDVGPISRYVGCLQALQQEGLAPSDEVFVVGLDDDLIYNDGTLRTLVCAKRQAAEHSWSGWRYKHEDLWVGQGADGLLMSSADLLGLPALVARTEELGRPCFRVDDLLVSWHLRSVGRPMKVRPPLPPS